MKPPDAYSGTQSADARPVATRTPNILPGQNGTSSGGTVSDSTIPDGTIPGDAVRISTLDTRQMLPRLRIRALTDAGLLLGITVASAYLLNGWAVGGPTATILLITVGALLFFWRRSTDFARLLSRQQENEHHLHRLGMPLADWHAGAELPPWSERRPGDS